MFYYVNNWDRWECGFDPPTPGPGSIVYFDWTSSRYSVRLYSDVDVQSITLNEQGTFFWYYGDITLRNPTNSAPGVFTNRGVVRIEDGTKQLYGTLLNEQNGQLRTYGGLTITRLRQTGGFTILLDGSITTLYGFNLEGGFLEGTGVVTGMLSNSAGTLSPGTETMRLGILTIDGNWTQGADGTVLIDLYEDAHDILYIRGINRQIQLNGRLHVSAIGNFMPPAGAAFDILLLEPGSSWNRIGTFSVVEADPSTLPCVGFEVQYLYDRVRLQTQRLGGADVDRSGCVDDADLLRVLFAFGSTGSRAEDTNCDGIVDDADLLIVLFNFGSGC
ncbi:MAG: hypothetical protein QXI60_07180 [Thermofilaceae archaeon]